MEKVERYEVGTGRKSRRGCGEVVRATDYDALAAELAAMREDRNLWRDEHNEGCPNELPLKASEEALGEAEAKIDAVRETLNTPSVMDIGFMLDKLREIVK